jgi:uncharacterized protein (TIGR00266 family)
MKVDIKMRPGSSVAEVQLDANEKIVTEGGAMVAMSSHFTVNTTTRSRGSDGGVMAGLKRMLSSESIFLNHYTANGKGGTIYLGTPLPGDIEVFELKGKKIFVQGGSYMASSEEVVLNTVWQGAKNILSGESLFWIELSGQGIAILNAFGVIYPIEIDGEYIVDTGHIVAYEEGLNFEITKAGSSWVASFLGGEGFVCKFRGKGTVWCQSHSSTSWGQAMTPNLTAVK